LTKPIFDIVGGGRVLTKRFTVQWPVDQELEEGSTTSNTVNANRYTLYEHHPLAALFGKYDDEPLWDSFEEAVKRLREEDNATIE
jgi:hypothetical protein